MRRYYFLLILKKGYPRLIDFGGSRIVKDKGSRTYTMTGTSNYMAPEIIEGKGYTQYIDLWALGVILYECSCGPSPFGDEDDPMKIYENIITKDLSFPIFLTGIILIDIKLNKINH